MPLSEAEIKKVSTLSRKKDFSDEFAGFLKVLDRKREDYKNFTYEDHVKLLDAFVENNNLENKEFAIFLNNCGARIGGGIPSQNIVRQFLAKHKRQGTLNNDVIFFALKQLLDGTVYSHESFASRLMLEMFGDNPLHVERGLELQAVIEPTLANLQRFLTLMVSEESTERNRSKIIDYWYKHKATKPLTAEDMMQVRMLYAVGGNHLASANFTVAWFKNETTRTSKSMRDILLANKAVFFREDNLDDFVLLLQELKVPAVSVAEICRDFCDGSASLQAELLRELVSQRFACVYVSDRAAKKDAFSEEAEQIFALTDELRAQFERDGNFKDWLACRHLFREANTMQRILPQASRPVLRMPERLVQAMRAAKPFVERSEARDFLESADQFPPCEDLRQYLSRQVARALPAALAQIDFSGTNISASDQEYANRLLEHIVSNARASSAARRGFPSEIIALGKILFDRDDSDRRANWHYANEMSRVFSDNAGEIAYLLSAKGGIAKVKDLLETYAGEQLTSEIRFAVYQVNAIESGNPIDEMLLNCWQFHLVRPEMDDAFHYKRSARECDPLYEYSSSSTLINPRAFVGSMQNEAQRYCESHDATVFSAVEFLLHEINGDVKKKKKPAASSEAKYRVSRGAVLAEDSESTALLASSADGADEVISIPTRTQHSLLVYFALQRSMPKVLYSEHLAEFVAECEAEILRINPAYKAKIDTARAEAGGQVSVPSTTTATSDKKVSKPVQKKNQESKMCVVS